MDTQGTQGGRDHRLIGEPPVTASIHPLCREGVTIAWGNPSDPATFPAGKFDIVYDNNGKDMEACKPLIDTYKVRVGPLLSL